MLRFCYSVVVLVALAGQSMAAGEAPRVEFIEARLAPIKLDLQISGTLSARDSVALGFRQSGRVTEVLVDEGDRVAAGDPLARLDAVQQEQGLQAAQASLAAARASYEQTRQANARATVMLERGVGTRAARDSAAQEMSQAQGAVERAESAVEQAQRAVDDTLLLAPDAAIVTSRDLEPGQIVTSAEPVITLAATGGLEATFRPPDHPLLKDAMGAQVRLEAIDVDIPDMHGVVSEIAPLVDPLTGTVTLHVEITDGAPADMNLLGAALRGHLVVDGKPGIVVPWTALSRKGENPAVWVVGDDNSVSLVNVEIGYFSDGDVYLSDGVEPGQIIVGAGSQQLFPGRKVQPDQ